MRSVSPHVQLARAAFNDHYSPVEAADYIDQRLRPVIAYYRRRVPFNTHFVMAIKLLLLGAAVLSSVLARANETELVTIATAFASMITAYSEFADAGRKVERCVLTYRTLRIRQTHSWAPFRVGRQVLSRDHRHRRLAHHVGIYVVLAEGVAN